MMASKLLTWSWTTFLYFSVATVTAQAAALGVVWVKGGLTDDKLVEILAVANDVDLGSMREKLASAARQLPAEHVSHDDVEDARLLVGLDLDLREIATDKALQDMRYLNVEFNREWEEYKELKRRFDEQLEKLQQGAADQSLMDVRRQLESVNAKLAKDQILRILDDPSLDPDVSMRFVVALFKDMPLDKRKRIIAEFKNEDTEQLHAILSRIRRGKPDVDLFRETRRQLQRFESRP